METHALGLKVVRSVCTNTYEYTDFTVTVQTGTDLHLLDQYFTNEN